MYAVIETGGKQYKVEKGDIILVEKLGVEAGKKVKFDVLAVVDGENTKIGAPTVKGVTVEAAVLESVKGKKVRIFKYKPKKGYHKRQGHRQPLDKIEIKAIKTAKPRAPKAETAEATEAVAE